MSVSVDWKPERAVQAKIKDMNKNDYSDRLKTQKGDLCKRWGALQSNCISQHHPLGASSYQKTSDSKHLQIKDSEQGQFKVVRENNNYCVQCTFPYYLPFYKKFQRSVEPYHWQATTQFIKFEHVPIYLELAFILFAKFLLFLMAILKAKIFKNIKLFLHLLKNVNKKHTLFELVSSWSVHQHPPREPLHSGRQTWLRTMEKTSALSKMLSQSKNTKKIYTKIKAR